MSRSGIMEFVEDTPRVVGHIDRLLKRLVPIAVAGVLLWGCSDSSTSDTPAAPTPCNYTLSVTSFSVAAGGGSGSSSLNRTTGSCGWTAASDASWLTVTPGSGADPVTVNFSAAANAGTDSRTGRITVSWNGGSTQLTVTQAGTPVVPPPPPPPPQPCTYTADPVAFTFPGTGGTGQSTLTVTGTNCSWSAFSNQGWIVINSGFTGTTTGTITFTIAQNPGPTRFGRIVITTTVGTVDLGFTQDPQPVAAVLTVTPNPCNVRPNPDPPNTDVTKDTNVLQCTFDASASLSASGVSSYDFWLGSPPQSVDSFLLSSSGIPIITNPKIGCGYTGGGDVTVNVYVIVNPNSGGQVISAPVALTLQKNGGC